VSGLPGLVLTESVSIVFLVSLAVCYPDVGLDLGSHLKMKGQAWGGKSVFVCPVPFLVVVDVVIFVFELSGVCAKS